MSHRIIIALALATSASAASGCAHVEPVDARRAKQAQLFQVGNYLIDARTQSCFLTVGGQSMGPVDCGRLAENVAEAKPHITWDTSPQPQVACPEPQPRAAPELARRPFEDDKRQRERGIFRAKLAAAVKTVADNHVSIPRWIIDEMLASPMLVAGRARLVPSIKDAKPNGFKLYAIHPGSVYDVVGFRNGDTVTAINGMGLSTPDKALDIYNKLKNAPRLTFEIVRRGKPVSLIIDIR